MIFRNNVIRQIKCCVLLFMSFTLFSCDAQVDDQQVVSVAREHYDQNQLRAAVIELKNALQVNPANAEARYLLGEIHFEVGDAASAEKEYKRAIERCIPRR